jgi:hypothetical protein
VLGILSLYLVLGILSYLLTYADLC